MRTKFNKSTDSRFGLEPDLLDKRHEIRNEKYECALETIKDKLSNVLNDYCDGDIVTRYSLEEYLIQCLIKDFRGREGYRI